MNRENGENSTWRCVFCDSINNETDRKCCVCEAIHEYRPDIQVILPNCLKPQRNESVLTSWTCDKCTMVNTSVADTCNACYNQGPLYNKWCCKHCTMINENCDQNCATCFNLNPDIKPCSQCGLKTVNVRYSDKCTRCIENSSVKENNNINWTCPMCTFINEGSIDNCSVCGELKRCRKIAFKRASVSVFTGGNELVRAQTRANSVSGNYQQRLGQIFCKRCNNVLWDDDDDNKLCHECNKEYYVCKNNTCGALVGPNQTECTRCIVNKDPSERQRGWLCSYNRCHYINDHDGDMCGECVCFRRTGDNKIACNSCGWIHFMKEKCAKCGSES